MCAHLPKLSVSCPRRLPLLHVVLLRWPDISTHFGHDSPAWSLVSRPSTGSDRCFFVLFLLSGDRPQAGGGSMGGGSMWERKKEIG